MRNIEQSTTQTLTIAVDRVRSTADNFSVFTGREDGTLIPIPLTVKMFTGPCRPGQRWTVCGAWQNDPKWGEQFCAQFGALATPRTWGELAAFLTSGLIDGWDWSTITALRDAFGDDACTVIESEPHRLMGEAGITADQYESLMEMWSRGAGLAPIYASLTEWGIGAALADRLVKRYRYAVLDVLEENPYAPIRDVSYFTWRVAENVAGKLEVAPDDPRRIEAGVAETIRKGALEEGHTWMTHGAAVVGARELLNLSAERIEDILEAVLVAMDDATEDATLVAFGDRLYPGALWFAEAYIAASIAQRLERRPLVAPARVETLEKPDHLSEEQWSAVAMALTNTVSLLTGGPGVGKTFSIKTLVEMATSLGLPVTLMAPTGKAAARMTEATGHAASTIHRKLKLIPGQCHVGQDAELLTGLVVVDEVSMLSTDLASALFSGIGPDAHILLVGDPDQLPSVGPGAVLRDLLAADVLTRIHLTKVFRNDAGVAINAAHIRAGEMIQSLPDCRLMQAAQPEAAQQMVVDLLVHELPKAGYTVDDVLVLCPRNDGPSGRHRLNTVLQAIYNGAQAGRGVTQKVQGKEESIEYELRVGDKVMVTKNQSELGVFNGDTGKVVSVNPPKVVTVDFDGRQVNFVGADQKLLQLAYAITIHKSQGSEAPVVISPIFFSRILSRELLYTGLTRARKQVYLLGDPAAIQGCIRTVRISERRTGLVARLAEMVGRTTPSQRPIGATHRFTGSLVYHARRKAIPWRTLCGLTTTGDESGHMWITEARPCKRCLAASGVALAPFPTEQQAMQEAV